jgi:hypothetical protein
MFDFMKSDLSGLIHRSAEAFEHYQEVKAMPAAPENIELLEQIEHIDLHLGSCKKLHLSPQRERELERQVRELIAEYRRPVEQRTAEIGEAEKPVLEISKPFLARFEQWGRELLRVAPVDGAFADSVWSAIHEVAAMNLQPLGEILKVIEQHQNKIRSWKFEGRKDFFPPSLNFQIV